MDSPTNIVNDQVKSSNLQNHNIQNQSAEKNITRKKKGL